jgi:hypothetical protein
MKTLYNSANTYGSPFREFKMSFRKLDINVKTVSVIRL